MDLSVFQAIDEVDISMEESFALLWDGVQKNLHLSRFAIFLHTYCSWVEKHLQVVHRELELHVEILTGLDLALIQVKNLKNDIFGLSILNRGSCQIDLICCRSSEALAHFSSQNPTIARFVKTRHVTSLVLHKALELLSDYCKLGL
jgi:hypothetical protein